MSMSHIPDENGQFDAETISLTDEVGRSLECYVEYSLEYDLYTYLLLQPVDSPIVILAWDDEEDDDVSEAFTIEEDAEIEEIFEDAKAVLAELDLNLKHTGFTLTASGELPPLEDDSILTLELDEEKEKSDIEPEELQYLASFYHLEQKYTIYTPLSPLLFLARYNLDGELELVSPEDEQMKPILEELLFDELD